MKQIPHKANPLYAGQVISPFNGAYYDKPSKRFRTHFNGNSVPGGKGLTKEMIKMLPKGITVVNKS